MPRRHADDEPGFHYVTFSCQRRLDVFVDDQLVELFLRALKRARARDLFNLTAYVIMPNHVHLLIEPKVSISSVLYAVKHPASRAILPVIRSRQPELYRSLRRRIGRRQNARLWMWGGGYDRVIRSEDEARAVIKYIHRNPVRRGLVEKPEQWKVSSFRNYYFEVDDPIAIDRPDWI